MYTPFLTSWCAGDKIKLAHSGDTNPVVSSLLFFSKETLLIAETVEILLSNSNMEQTQHYRYICIIHVEKMIQVQVDTTTNKSLSYDPYAP